MKKSNKIAIKSLEYKVCQWSRLSRRNTKVRLDENTMKNYRFLVLLLGDMEKGGEFPYQRRSLWWLDFNWSIFDATQRTCLPQLIEF